MPSVTVRRGRLALPFHVKPNSRPEKRATRRSRTTVRPCEDWKTSTSASRCWRRLKFRRTREPAGRAPTAAKPEVAAHADGAGEGEGVPDGAPLVPLPGAWAWTLVAAPGTSRVPAVWRATYAAALSDA